MRIYVLETRLVTDFCEYCDIKFKMVCEKDKKDKNVHIRNTQTFECSVYDFKLQNNEELVIYLSTGEMYVCSLCSYIHERLSELKSHCKTKHTRNTIIKLCKMDKMFLLQKITLPNISVRKSESYSEKKVLCKLEKSLEKTLDKHFMCFWSNPFVVILFIATVKIE